MSAGPTGVAAIPLAITPRVFRFHADASPFGGVLTVDGATVVIPTAGSASLSHAGGESTHPGEASSVEGISVGTAHSSMTGVPGSDWTTVVTSEVNDLDILGIVKAKRLTLRIKVIHPSASSCCYPSIEFQECTFDGLTVNGKDIIPTYDLGQYARSVSDVLQSDCCWLDDIDMVSAVRKQMNAMVKSSPPLLGARYAWVTKPNQRRAKGHVICSLVTGFSQNGGFASFGHVLEVPGFGHLFFGELVVSHGSFGVTMLRAELLPQAARDGKKTLSGTVAIATAHTNGSSSP